MSTTKNGGPPHDVVLLSCCSRKQALEDGVLVDVSDLAREAGFRYPVALTRAVYAECVTVPEGMQGQDQKGRLWDVLWMMRVAVIRHRSWSDSRLPFELYVQNDRGKQPELVKLVAEVGPGDTMEPVVTVMLPTED